jgi:signal peptidase I
LKLWIPLAALALALSPLAVVHPVRVSGRSMEPDLPDASLRFALRARWSGAPARGEVWLVEGPEGPAVKRVVGMPHESWEQKEGELLLEGHRFEETYVEHPEHGDGGPWDTGEGYLLLGDNRPESHDGRVWGSLPRSAFRARLLGVSTSSPR